MTLATRIGVMNHGEIVQVGTPAEIYEYPGSPLRRRLHRHVNLFEGRSSRTSRTTCVVALRRARRQHLRRPRRQRRAAARRSAWRVRPEKIRISARAAEPTGDNASRGVVADIAYFGDQSLYLRAARSGPVVRVTAPDTCAARRDRVAWDDESGSPGSRARSW